MIESLYSRLGGDDTLRAAVDIFYGKVLNDDRIARHFRDIDMAAQKAKQRAFLSYVLGGPVLYSGKEMRARAWPSVDSSASIRPTTESRTLSETHSAGSSTVCSSAMSRAFSSADSPAAQVSR